MASPSSRSEILQLLHRRPIAVHRQRVYVSMKSIPYQPITQWHSMKRENNDVIITLDMPTHVYGILLRAHVCADTGYPISIETTPDFFMWWHILDIPALELESPTPYVMVWINRRCQGFRVKCASPDKAMRQSLSHKKVINRSSVPSKVPSESTSSSPSPSILIVSQLYNSNLKQ